MKKVVFCLGLLAACQNTSSMRSCAAISPNEGKQNDELLVEPIVAFGDQGAQINMKDMLMKKH